TPTRMTQADADAVFAAGGDEKALHSAVAGCCLRGRSGRLRRARTQARRKGRRRPVRGGEGEKHPLTEQSPDPRTASPQPPKPPIHLPSRRRSDKVATPPIMETMPMTEEAVTIPSAGLKLSGVVHVPRGLRPSERRGAFLVLHGFGSNKTSSNTMQPTKVLSDLGYVVLRFDMRCCGDSEGEFGRVICLEQVEDTRNALTFLAQHPAVDAERIGLIGSSFGGAVAIYTGGVDQRVAAVISNGGWGDGERKFRGQHKSPQEWARFTDMLKDGREHRARTGKSLMVPRYDIVPI